MALTDISVVTRSIINLIERNLLDRFGQAAVGTAAPPDSSATANNLINVFLYHLIEEAHYKNFPPLFPATVAGEGSASQTPIQLAPMGVALHYVITAQQGSNQDVEDPPGVNAQREQKLLGFVAKTLHDYPIVSDSTKVAGQLLFDDPLTNPGPGPDNQIHLALRPVTIEQSLGFWGVQNAKIARLSLFVEARVILLEAERPKVAPGVVLSVGDFVFVGAGPQLVASESTVRFRPPTTPAATPNDKLPKALASPARVAIFDQTAIPGTVPADNNRLILTGSGLGPRKRFLFLRRPEFEAKIALDPVDPGNTDWQIDATSTRIAMRVRPEVTSEPIGSATGGVKTFVPGIYAARVSVEVDEQRPRVSNEIAFALTPQIASITKAADIYTLTIVPAAGYLQTPAIEIQLAAGSEVLTSSTAAPDPAHPEGEFQVTGGSTIAFTRKSTEPAAVRLVVNGAAAPPFWIVT
jgi:hypothetical protein